MLFFVFVLPRQAFFKKWGDEGEVDLLQELSDLIILTASRCLMGKEVRESLFEKVSGLFHYLDMGMRPISVIFPYLPIKAHRDRDWARAQLAEIFAKIINNRRDSGVTEPDVLQVCVRETSNISTPVWIGVGMSSQQQCSRALLKVR